MNYQMLGAIDPVTGVAVHPATLKPPEETAWQKFLREQRLTQFPGGTDYYMKPQVERPGYHWDFTTGGWAKDATPLEKTAAVAETVPVTNGNGAKSIAPVVIGAAVAYLALK